MQPEDIDKLFREKLERHAPPPPDYLWAQLEAELQPARKRPVMWLYASAAVITLLMLAGAAWLWRGANLAPAVGTLAKVTTQSAPKKTEAVSSKNSSYQATLPAAQPSTPIEAAVATAPTKQLPSEAQPMQPLRSKPATTRQLARATGIPRSSSSKKLSTPPAQNTMVATLTPTKAQPERPVTEETQPNAPQQLPTVATASTTPSVPTGPIEVEVRQSSATALAATQEAPRRGRLGGQVMRQVSNALRGEPVTLPRLPEDVTVTVRPPGVNHALVIQL
ncbi:hypothetical protein [Hymenobacter sp. HDW8]|uniref:hypothetical protein n=1 Tax=Hymenobacter sp. HDW8 TaxID=2714932 RepID=UPI00140CB460|nr:hypothetical protein [Hymenobacter sp. HDW8]QIL74878.1 hypothetical protein G7064_02650 [Hymenobacter sp. HDW8]